MLRADVGHRPDLRASSVGCPLAVANAGGSSAGIFAARAHNCTGVQVCLIQIK